MALLTSAEIDHLRDDGFVVVRGFLRGDELAFLAQQHERGAHTAVGIGLMPPELVSPYRDRMHEVAHTVGDAGIHVDRVEGGLWFSTAKGINFGWHQDHDSYYSLQNHSDYLNVYVPIIKPEVAKTNLTMVPFSVLRAKAPDDCRELLGGGANRFRSEGGRTVITNNEQGGTRTMPVDIEEIAVAPELAAGDAIIMRGDVIHRTQDATTTRISASFRLTNSQGVIRRQQLCAGGFHKWVVMLSGPQHYEAMLRLFAARKSDEVTVGEMLDHLAAQRDSVIAFPMLQKTFAERVARFMADLARLDGARVREALCDCDRCKMPREWLQPILSQIDRLSATGSHA